jgi:hypothetical protein
VPAFETRRINFTFQYVPNQDWVDFKDLSSEKRADILPYVQELSVRSPFLSRYSIKFRAYPCATDRPIVRQTASKV